MRLLRSAYARLYGFSVKRIKTKKGRVGKDRLMRSRSAWISQ